MNGQLDIFSIGKEPLKIKNKIRLIELFGGIGAQAKALENLNADFEHYRLCEIDPYAVTSYNAIHGTNFEPTDITKLKGADLGVSETDRFTYLLTYLLLPLSKFEFGRQTRGNGRGQRNSIELVMGS
jgi:DNA (cytosine-5)-methyltransferase 1